jgi:peptide/nickel transport system substrate-binding protein
MTVITGASLLTLVTACGGAAAGNHPGSHVADKVAASHSRAPSQNLVIGTTEEPDTLNPQLTQLVTSDNVLSGIMEGMIDHNTKEGVVYRLATSYNVSKDGLTYTWHLRHGVKFQNGQAFDARDIVAMWHMIMNKKFGSYSTDGWSEITKISTPNPYTVVMQTKEKFAPFVTDVGDTYIAPRTELAKGVKYYQQKFGRHPIGTGPFTFVKWNSGDSIVMKRNPDYWGQKAKLNTITFKIVPNDNTLMVQLKTGEVQMTDSQDPDRYPTMKKMPNVRVVVVPSLSWYHIDLKNIGLLREDTVRVALAYATPVQEIINRLTNGLALPCPTDQTPGTWAYNPHVKLYPYDLKKAESMLLADGFKKGSDGTLEKNGQKLAIDYWIPSGEQLTSQIMQVVAASWKQIGVTVTQHQQDINSIWGPNGYQFNKKMTAGAYSWFNNDDPDDRFYWNSVDIPKTPTGTGGDAPEYFGKYPWQAQIDKLTNEGARTINQKARQKIYWKVDEVLHQHEPVIFMYSLKLIYGSPKNFSGFTPSAYTSLLSTANTWQFT